jgi:membrane protease YdiL (CAAX protease family)
MRAFVKRHSLLLYFVFAFLWFWGSIALNYTKQFRFWSLMVGALAPTICAVTVIGISEGEDAVRGLVRRLWKWRVGWRWYGIAVGLPVAEALIAVGIASWLGVFKPARINLEMLRATLPGFWIVFLFAECEELGWRGYALPRLLDRQNAVIASLILGTIHAVWHWPLVLLPHQYMSDIPVLPFTGSLAAEAIVFTWIYRNTGGSVMLAALPWFRSSTDIFVSVLIVLVAGTELMRKEATGVRADNRTESPRSEKR